MACEHTKAYVYKTFNPGGDKKITRQRLICPDCHSDMLRERDSRVFQAASDGSDDGLRASYTERDDSWRVIREWGPIV